MVAQPTQMFSANWPAMLDGLSPSLQTFAVVFPIHLSLGKISTGKKKNNPDLSPPGSWKMENPAGCD